MCMAVKSVIYYNKRLKSIRKNFEETFFKMNIYSYYSFYDFLHAQIKNNTQLVKPETQGAKPQLRSAHSQPHTFLQNTTHSVLQNTKHTSLH